MLEYSFSVKHEGCWTADINHEFPNVSATILQSHALGAELVEAYVATKRRSLAAFRDAVTDWERDQYVELL